MSYTDLSTEERDEWTAAFNNKFLDTEDYYEAAARILLGIDVEENIKGGWKKVSIYRAQYEHAGKDKEAQISALIPLFEMGYLSSDSNLNRGTSERLGGAPAARAAITELKSTVSGTDLENIYIAFIRAVSSRGQNISAGTTVDRKSVV